MATSTWFVNGSSRGVGLEFVKQLSTVSKNRVIAGARKPADSIGLQKLKESASNVTLVQLDQTDPDSIKVPLLRYEWQLADVKARHTAIQHWMETLAACAHCQQNDMTHQNCFTGHLSTH